MFPSALLAFAVAKISNVVHCALGNRIATEFRGIGKTTDMNILLVGLP
jgi:hypothetical protein